MARLATVKKKTKTVTMQRNDYYTKELLMNITIITVSYKMSDGIDLSRCTLVQFVSTLRQLCFPDPVRPKLTRACCEQ